MSNGTSNSSASSVETGLSFEPEDIAFAIGVFFSIILVAQVSCSIYYQYKNMQYAQINWSAYVFFLSLALLQLNTVAMVYSPEEVALLLQGANKLIYGCLLLQLFYYFRIIVFFENLFKVSAAYQQSMFTSNDDSDDYARVSQPHRRSIILLDEKREKLLNVQFDKAFDEEKARNTIFPSSELQRLQPSVDEQQRDILEKEVLDVGRVNRCCEFCAAEEFETLDDARQYLIGVLVAIWIYIVYAAISAITMFVLENYNLMLTFDLSISVILFSIESILAIYMIYSMFQLSDCLSESIIKDYEPNVKFFWFLMLALFVLLQPPLCYFASLFISSPEFQNPQIYNVPLLSVELLVIYGSFQNHFLVRHPSQVSNQTYSELDKSASEVGRLQQSPSDNLGRDKILDMRLNQ